MPLAEQHAAMELFRGTMTRHSFIARHAGDTADLVGFGGDSAGGLIPIRTAASIVVDRNLPEGAAGALLNRAHTYPDLVVLVDDHERRLFESIDGRRTIGELCAATVAAVPDFFELFWQHDLIVIDASR